MRHLAGSQSALIGIDIGTSSIKVGAFDLCGKVIVLRRGATPTRHIGEGWAEHDAEGLWTLVRTLLGEVCRLLPSGTTVEAIAPTSVGEAGVPVDGEGVVLRPAIAWFDARTTAEATWWEEAAGAAAVYRITGQPIDPHYGANKLLWIRKHEPEVFSATRKWLSLADFIILRLSGAYATDRSLASRMMLFDQGKSDWSDDLIRLTGLDRQLFPSVFVGGTYVGGLLGPVAHDVGLSPGTPIVTGGHDRLCGAFAARGGKKLLVDSTGSAEAAILPADNFVMPSPDNVRFIACYADVVPGQYVYSARIGYAGALVDWFRRELGGAIAATCGSEPLSVDDLESLIPRPLAYSGLLIYPAFGRVIGPLWDPMMRRGAVLGLKLEHKRGHIYQALLEGICFSLRANLDSLQEISKQPIGRIRVEGGATRSEVWLQLKADISGREIDAVRLDEPTSLGAALLAGVGAGVFADHRAAGAAVLIDSDVRIPDPQRQAVFDAVFQDVYLAVPSLLSGIAGALEKVNAPSSNNGRSRTSVD